MEPYQDPQRAAFLHPFPLLLKNPGLPPPHHHHASFSLTEALCLHHHCLLESSLCCVKDKPDFRAQVHDQDRTASQDQPPTDSF